MKKIRAVAALMLLASTPAYAGLDPFLGEIQTFAFNFCPSGFRPLNGQLLPIADNTLLFSLLGTSYGGNGSTTFALPTGLPIFTANGAPLLQCIYVDEDTGIFPAPNPT